MATINEEQLKFLAIKLHEINALKFGDFEMKVGMRSPVYFDLRVIISHPDVMDLLSDLLLDFAQAQNIEYDHLCGVPYTALPIATLVSIKDKKPMLIRRKETKTYGTKKLIEGKFRANDKCLIVEDVVTSGSSILETAKDLQSEGIVVTDTIVVVNREQGGADNIKQNGIQFHSLFTLSQLLRFLREADKIDDAVVDSVAKYIAASQIPNGPLASKRTSLTYEIRANHTKCLLAKELFAIIATKKTNLCLAADVTKSAEILSVADAVGPHICVLKTHVDIIEDFSDNFVHSLTVLAKKHNFLVMEDRKFADIGNTVSLQYSSGIFKVAEWAHLITVHSLTGPSILKGLKNALSDSVGKRGAFLLAEISSAESLISTSYAEATVKLAEDKNNADFVAGIVCQNSGVVKNIGLLQLTPGCQIGTVSDGLGQQYNTPEYVIKEKGADIAVVGRGILAAKDVRSAAILYQNRLWAAYCERVGIDND